MLTFLVSICILPLGYADFTKECLDAHNKYREKHRAPPMILDVEVLKFSQDYAHKLAATNKFEHSTGSEYGENLYMSLGLPINADTAVKAWYDEIKDYDFNKAKFSIKTGHFTQVVWKTSIKLGCAFAKSGKTAYVVANYKPSGNLDGAFKANVLPSSADKSFWNPLLLLFIFLDGTTHVFH